MRKRLIYSIFTAFWSLTVQAQAPVWEVSKDGGKLYIGGTVHVLSAQDFPLPKAFDYAFSKSQIIVFETDLDAASSPAIQAKFLEIMIFQDGSTLRSVLNDETYSMLQSFLLGRNIQIQNFQNFTPAGISLTLTILEMQRLGITEENGVEAHFSRLAKSKVKPVYELETIEQQIEFFKSLNNLDADMLVSSTIRDAEELKDQWQKMIDAWRKGDVAKLETLFIGRMIQEAPDLYQTILVDRNRNWLAKIDEHVSSPRIEFVLVGALHLSGQHSLLSMLKSAGYQVRQLK